MTHELGNLGAYDEAEVKWGLGRACANLGKTEEARSWWRESAAILHNLSLISVAEKLDIETSVAPRTPEIILRNM
ncbi:hypothetical protein [Nonomuraea diastatica]|uniref:Tetratricopeptide repeat protein n=1 Tax=Nonomuraea diastatica TaxID=1848329 RepID=A0A4R4WC97_9ACTN|nr:hypothetical protein [Nonomuraea diastatica]TDD16508.1 hypothetical protein E1294_31075 [Nonomuraea diastatica]